MYCILPRKNSTLIFDQHKKIIIYKGQHYCVLTYDGCSFFGINYFWSIQRAIFFPRISKFFDTLSSKCREHIPFLRVRCCVNCSTIIHSDNNILNYKLPNTVAHKGFKYTKKLRSAGCSLEILHGLELHYCVSWVFLH